jgi:hypothetical protein
MSFKIYMSGVDPLAKRGVQEASYILSISAFVSEAMFQIVTNVLLLNAVLVWSLCHYFMSQ